MELQHFAHWIHALGRHQVRPVFRAIAAYGVVAFAVVEVTEPVMHALHLPEWILTLVVVLLGLGFPVVAVAAWIFPGSSDRTSAGSGGGAHDRGAPVPTAAASGPGRLVVAALLAGVGLLVAAPGLIYYLVLRDRGEDVNGAAAHSVAVLPFADLSPGKDQEYFADGIAEEILNALVHVDGLRVAGRASSFSFKGKSTALSDIGRELKVRTLLSGSVRKDGNRVRITAEMTDAVRGTEIWSERYDRELTGIFAVQDEIASAVVEALKVKMSRRPAVAKQRRPTNPDAYSAYLLGRHYFDLGTPDSMSKAVSAIEKALSYDPEYAAAWAWLSVSILNSRVYLARDPSAAATEEAVRRATAAADRAVELGPELAECWSARGWMRTSIAWDWAGAEADFQRALALNGRDPNILVRYSHVLAVLGRLPEAIATAHKVLEIDPLYSWGWDFLSGYELGAGRPNVARDAASRALEIAPDHIYSRMSLGIADLLLGEPQAALAEFQRDKSEVIRLAGTALAEHTLGRAENEEEAIAALRARFSESEPYEIATVYAWRGDRDEAFAWLNRAIDERGGRGVSRLRIRWMKTDPLFANVRDDPRWEAALRRMGLPTR